MIEIHDGKSPIVQYHLFLSGLECDFIDELSVTLTDWQPGRQGGGYFKADLMELVDQGRYDEDLDWLFDIYERAVEQIRTKSSWQDLNLKTDAWLLFYPSDSCVPLHKDPAPGGNQVMRLNALVRAPAEGGNFMLAEPQDNGNEPIYHHYQMNRTGEALLFSPTRFEHRVQRCDGNRMVLSIGAHVD